MERLEAKRPSARTPRKCNRGKRPVVGRIYTERVRTLRAPVFGQARHTK